MNQTIPATGRVLARQDQPGGYTLLRVATDPAADPQPGQALRVGAELWPVLRSAPDRSWADCLRRGVAGPAAGAEARVTGPAGEPFDLASATPRALLLADGDGIAPILFLARALRDRHPRVKPFVLFGLTPPLPFRPQPSRIMTPGLPADAIAALPLLEDWNIPSRIACAGGGQAGCFDGAVTELARGWLDVSQGVADVTVFGGGGDELLESARALAGAYRLACQLRPAPPS
jgi:dihydroorotate dehydrogenase electron transfer subunit